MTLKIYGNMKSSAFRCVWAAEELGIEYKLVEVPTEKCATDGQLASLNPNRKIPVLDDNGIVLWESMAINLNLARKAGGRLAPSNEVEDAQMLMWALWVTGECVADCFAVLSNACLLPETERSSKTITAALNRLHRPLEVLDAHLKTNEFVVGYRFTIADVNVASVVGWLVAAGRDLSEYADLSNWMEYCSARPAAKKCTEMAAAVE